MLVVAEIALSVAPLFGAGLLLGSLARLARVDLGFDHANVVTARIGISLSRYPGAADRWLLYRGVTDLVGLRTQEFALRLALGASLRQIAACVAGEGAVLTVVGAAIGVAGAWAIGRAVAGSLYGVGPLDPGTLAGVGLVLGAAAGVAVFHPA